MKKLTIGILAHVDAGKTTLSEALLYCSGTIRSLGRVDKKDTFLDTHSLERDRGITIFSKQAVIKFNDTKITLIDTPGHADFSPEAERTLSVLDAAIIVISASDGIQSHAETLWKLTKRHNIPVFIFVNKMDLPNSGREVLLADIRRKFSDICVDQKNLGNTEEVSILSEHLLEKYLSGEGITQHDISHLIAQRKLVPCYFGSALKNDGAQKLLCDLDKYLQSKSYNENFGARVFKITQSEKGERLAHIKITGGVLNVKDKLCGIQNGKEWEEKAEQIRVYSGTKYESVNSAYPGDIVCVTGLSKIMCGDGLGFEQNADSPLLEPVLSYKVVFDAKLDIYNVLSDFQKLQEQEPTLKVSFNEHLKEIYVLVMGEVQLEVLKFRVKELFGYDIDFGNAGIVYRETIDNTVEGVGHYEPLRHYSEVHLILEPAQRGSGLSFEADCSENSFARNWQRLVLTHLAEKTHLGVLTGSPITDMKITLVAGKAHKKHTEGGDFRQATYRAVRQGLMYAKSVVLEPHYNFEITLPTELVGRAMTDIQRKGGHFSPPEILPDGFSSLKGSGPVASLRTYPTELTAYSHGKGNMVYSLKGYEPCHNQEQVIEQADYDPEADLYNSPDSVFCEGGAGFNVKWNEVYNYMHLESVLNSKPEQDPVETAKSRAKTYANQIATDKELMEIFERTYGPIKQRSFNNVVTVSNKKVQDKPKPQKNPSQIYNGKEYLLIDGYNIIFAWDELKILAADSLDCARNQLIGRLCNYQGYSGIEIILVFDAYKVKKNPGTVENFRNIQVVYTKEAQTADSYIEKVSHELSKNNRVRVATSDKYEQMIILGNGALRIPAAAFHKELKDAEAAISDIVGKQL